MVSDRTDCDLRTADDTAAATWQPLGRDIVFTAKALRTAFEEVLARAGGSLGTWIVLSALSRGGLVPQKVLAGHVHIEGATMTHHVDRLEAQGLVRRKTNPADRRVRHVEATPAGKRLYRRLLREAETFERELLAGIDAAEQRQLRSMLARIASNIALLNG
jgi:DNA-binding MarR family transcriptional regulator